MNQTQKLLNSVVENARSGADACEQLLNKTEESQETLRSELTRILERYRNSAGYAERALSSTGAKPAPQNPLSKAGMWIGTQMNTLTDRSASHIADMVIQGATMGVIEMTRERNALLDADDVAQGLASRFITDQQEHIERMKAYL